MLFIQAVLGLLRSHFPRSLRSIIVDSKLSSLLGGLIFFALTDDTGSVDVMCFNFSMFPVPNYSIYFLPAQCIENLTISFHYDFITL